MTLDALLAGAVVASTLILVIKTKIPIEVVFSGAVIFLILTRVLTPSEALAGFINEGLITILMLYVVARGLTETGLIADFAEWLLGKSKTVAASQFRLMGSVAAASAFMNNTPIVAMLIPTVSDWAKRNRLPIGQLMIPLSYASIVGGSCTLIGTSTNLIVNGLLLEQNPGFGLGMFELAWVGIPCAVVVIGFTMLFSRWLLPSDTERQDLFDDARKYTLHMQVEKNSPLVGKSIEDAGLRQMPGTFLVEISRGDRLLPAVSPDEILQAGDILMFAGIVEAVVDLKKIRGLVPATDQVAKLDALKDQRSLAEVVVSDRCPVVGKTVRDGRFRNLYDAAIIAVSREGTQIKQKIGDITLRPGDMLLLETHRDFADKQKYSKDFFLASRVEGSEPVKHEKRSIAGVIVILMVTVFAAGWYSMMQAALLAAVLMLLTGCVTARQARQSIDMAVYFVIGSAIALGAALEKTGVIAWLAQALFAIQPQQIHLSLAIVFSITAALTSLISNAAAAVLLFPLVIALAEQMSMSPMPFVVTLMVAASASFATPIGYQTNLMVAGPGGYQFKDFLRIGLPITVLVGITTVFVVPVFWAP